MELRSAQDDVKTFHLAMLGQTSAPDAPLELARYPGELRCRLLDEEAAEFRSAWVNRDRLGMIDALCDLLYVTLGAAVQMGISIEPFFEEVHRANMTKADGPIRSDGKKLKPPGWQPPDLIRIFDKLYPEVCAIAPIPD